MNSMQKAAKTQLRRSFRNDPQALEFLGEYIVGVYGALPEETQNHLLANPEAVEMDFESYLYSIDA